MFKMVLRLAIEGIDDENTIKIENKDKKIVAKIEGTSIEVDILEWVEFHYIPLTASK